MTPNKYFILHINNSKQTLYKAHNILGRCEGDYLVGELKYQGSS